MTAIKQYVNLPAEANKPFGNKVILKAKPTQKKKLFGKRQCLWEVVKDGKNVDEKYLAAAQRAKVKDAESTEKGGEFETELSLTHCGKDLVTVKCKKKAKKKEEQTVVHEKQFETWRRIYMTVHYQNADCKNIYDAIKPKVIAAFEPAGVEVSEKDVVAMDVDEAESEFSGGNYDLKQLYTGEDPPELDPPPPFHLKLLLVNDLVEYKEGSYDVTVDSSMSPEDWDTDPDKWLIDADAGKRPASKGTVKVAVLSAPSRLTGLKLAGLTSPKAGDLWTIEDTGTLTKGNLSISAANTAVAYDGAGWVKTADKGAKTVADLEKVSAAKGDVYAASDAGTLTKGSLAVTKDQKVLWTGSAWVKLSASKGAAWVSEVNKPSPKPSGVSDPDLAALHAPAEGDAWTTADAGTISRGALAVKKGHLVVWKGGKFVLHVGKWTVHSKPGWKFSTRPGKAIGASATGTPDGGSAVDVKDAIEQVSVEEIKLPLDGFADLNDAIDRGVAVTFTIDVGYKAPGGCCGYSIGNLCVVRINEKPATRNTTILQTITHEVGHGLQQARQKFDVHDGNGTKTGTEDNAIWHTNDYGGQGPHCWHNAKKVSSEYDDNGTKKYSTTSHFTYEHDTTKGKMCTMFFRDDGEVDPDGKFCPTCIEGLRRTRLDEAAMQAKDWDMFS